MRLGVGVAQLHVSCYSGGGGGGYWSLLFFLPGPIVLRVLATSVEENRAKTRY